MKALREEYQQRYDNALKYVASKLELQLRDLVTGEPRIDRVTTRAKSVDSFMIKANALDAGRRKYRTPLVEIQDQIGARIVTFYVSDVAKVDHAVKRYFNPIEIKAHIPENDSEFGYFGQHYILPVPDDCISFDVKKSLVPAFFELQIKTLFQHAWSEAGHDLGYKSAASPLNSNQKRLLAFASAQAWGADKIFDELFLGKLAS